jgi:hypothetical protein
MIFKNLKKNSTAESSNSDNNPITRRKKERELKKELTFKALLAIFLTNLMTYQLALPSDETRTQSMIGDKETVIKVPLQNFSSTDGHKVSIYTQNNRLVDEDVELIEKLNELYEGEIHTANFYLIKIQKNKISKFIGEKNQIFKAYPTTKKTKLTGEVYELDI